jgi:hypothetical protein
MKGRRRLVTLSFCVSARRALTLRRRLGQLEHCWQGRVLDLYSAKEQKAIIVSSEYLIQTILSRLTSMKLFRRGSIEKREKKKTKLELLRGDVGKQGNSRSVSKLEAIVGQRTRFGSSRGDRKAMRRVRKKWEVEESGASQAKAGSLFLRSMGKMLVTQFKTCALPEYDQKAHSKGWITQPDD